MFRAARARRWRWMLTFTEAVRVDTTNGTPSVGLTLGGTAARRAGYLRGDGTVDYVARRTGDGRTKREIIRCLKRFLAREIYRRVMTDFRMRQTRQPGRLMVCLDT